MAGFGILNDPTQANFSEAQRQGSGGIGAQAGATGLAALAAGGQAPSAADATMRAGLLQAQQAGAATAASTRGNFGLAGAQHAAQAGAAGMQQQAINAGAAQRAQEMAQARGQYIQSAEAERQAALQQAGMSTQQAMGNAQLGQQQNMANQQMSGQLLGGAMSAGGAILGGAAMYSDERLKEERPNGGGHADAFLSSLSPHEFNWAAKGAAPSPEAASHPNLGIMAQEVERSPAGGAIVSQDPASGYKKLDAHALLSALAAGVGRLHERTRALEEMGRGGR